MPFKSKAQQKYMFLKHPKIAKKWAHKTPDMGALPGRITIELTKRMMKKRKK